MCDEGKTKSQLLKEIEQLRTRVSELEASEAEWKLTEHELRKDKHKLHQMQLQYQALLRSTPHGMCMLSPNWEIVFANHSMAKILDPNSTTTLDMIGLPLKVLFPSNQAFIEYINSVDHDVRMRGIHKRELKLRRLDRSEFWCEISIVRLDPGETASGYVATLSDITERKQAIDELNRVHQIYRMAIENAQGVPYQLNYLKNTYEFIGEKCEELLGIPANELTFQKMKQLIVDIFITDPDAPSDPIECGNAFREGKLKRYNADYRIITPHGELKWLSDCSLPIRDEKTGKVIGALGILHNITERKEAEHELRKSRDELRRMQLQYQAVLRSTPHGLCMMTPNWRIVFANRSMYTLINPNAESNFDLVGLSLETLFPSKQDFEKYRDSAIHEVRMRGFDKRELKLRRINKTDFWCEISIVRLDPSQTAPGYVATLSDITERKQAEEDRNQSYKKLQKAMEGIVKAMAETIELRDPYTAGHQQHVSQLACAIAREMGLPENQIEGIQMAALIHDIGKIHIPAEILSKPGPLSQIEFSMISTHPRIGHDLLKTIEFPWPIADIVLQHHERMDGSGYPQGLKGDDILLEARILAVADVVESMAYHRPYRPAYGIDKALEEISQYRGIRYDPAVVDACLKLFTEKGFLFGQA